MGVEVDRRTASQVATVRSLLQELLAVDVTTLDPAQADTLQRDLRVVSDQVQAFRARLLACVEADGRWSAGDARTFPEWVARRSLVSVGDARRDAELGRALGGDLPATAAAVAAGEITLEHARVLTRFAPTSEARRAALAGGQPEQNEAFLVDQARRTPADQYGKLVRRWANGVDEASAEREHEVACAKEYLIVTRRDGGVALQGFLTTERGALLITALRAVTGVPSADDPRTHEERQASALAGLARIALDGAKAGGGQVRPHLSVHVSWEAMQRLAAEHHAGGAASPAQLDDGEPIPASLLARIACDSEVSRIVFGPAGQVLDVGRAQRTYTGQLRRALVARDRHCQYPGCSAPASMSEGHHRVPWSRGGLTSLANAILICWYHHDLVHRRGITIDRDEHQGWTFHRHDGTRVNGPAPPEHPLGEHPPGESPGRPGLSLERSGVPDSRPRDRSTPQSKTRGPERLHRAVHDPQGALDLEVR